MALPDIQVDDPVLHAREPEGEYRCTICGYRAAAAREPEQCPMCQCAAWDWAPLPPRSRNPLLAAVGPAGVQRLRVSERLRAL